MVLMVGWFEWMAVSAALSALQIERGMVKTPCSSSE
jgi:hypothetical protein